MLLYFVPGSTKCPQENMAGVRVYASFALQQFEASTFVLVVRSPLTIYLAALDNEFASATYLPDIILHIFPRGARAC